MPTGYDSGHTGHSLAVIGNELRGVVELVLPSWTGSDVPADETLLANSRRREQGLDTTNMSRNPLTAKHVADFSGGQPAVGWKRIEMLQQSCTLGHVAVHALSVQIGGAVNISHGEEIRGKRNTRSQESRMLNMQTSRSDWDKIPRL